MGFSFIGSSAFASDNVLQAIQVDGVKDSYNIILKSDDVADVKKTVQAPNKMVLNLNGIRASKTINTIYNNTSNVDSVVVEPTGEDSVKILIQADNAANAEVKFDTLKTPLGVLGNASTQTKSTDELVLNSPIQSYKPVYDDSLDQEEEGFLTGASGFISRNAKRLFQNEKISWMLTLGLLAMFFIGGLKTIKGKDSDIKVGLSQGLRQREVDLYAGLNNNINPGVSGEISNASMNLSQTSANQNLAGSSYGLRAYQNGTRSSYLTSEIQQRPRPMTAPPVAPQPAQKSVSQRPMAQGPSQATMTNTLQAAVLKAAPMASGAKTTNIDSIKFLESMTKIYEKNGRSDLAQGLKANMKKAKANLV